MFLDFLVWIVWILFDFRIFSARSEASLSFPETFFSLSFFRLVSSLITCFGTTI